MSENMALQTTDIGQDLRLGEVLIKSGFFKDVKDANQAVVKILIGRELGIGPMTAIRNVMMVEGKPELSAGLIGALLKRAGYDWRIVTLDDNGCQLEVRRGQTVLGNVGFSAEDLKRSGLASRPNWRGYSPDMFFARAISRLARRYAPETLMGNVYAEGELGAIEMPVADVATGEIVDADYDATPTATEPEQAKTPALSAPLMPKWDQLATHLAVKRLWPPGYIKDAVAVLKLRGADREQTAAQVERWSTKYATEPNALLADLQSELAELQQPALAV